MQTTASITINVTCTNATSYNIGVNSGSHQGSGNYNWNMTGSNGGLLHYELWRDAAYSLIWGNTVGTDTQGGTGTGGNQAVSVYGRIPAAQSVTIGTYSDVVIVTITY